MRLCFCPAWRLKVPYRSLQLLLKNPQDWSGRLIIYASNLLLVHIYIYQSINVLQHIIASIHKVLPHTHKYIANNLGYSGWCQTRYRNTSPYSFAANLKTGPVIYRKGYLGLDRYDSEQSRTEQHSGCILRRILVWLMDPF